MYIAPRLVPTLLRSLSALCLVALLLALFSKRAFAQPPDGEGDDSPPATTSEDDTEGSDDGSKRALTKKGGSKTGGETPLMGPTSTTSAGKKGASPAGQKKAGDQAKGDKKKAGDDDKKKPSIPQPPDRLSEIYAEDWWTTAHPVFELHGYYRVRWELFYNFALGRKDPKPLWPQPADKDYVDTSGSPHNVKFCGDDPLNPEPCDGNTNAGANMRFRLTPELHISDNLRVMAQIDMLDNVVLGSTPDGYANQPSANGGYQVVARGGYSPTSAFTTTQWAPVSGYNSPKDSIMVKRVWGEYSTPIGQLRFGRMPSHWGLGILANGGDDYDGDYQSTADRIMFITGIKSWDLYFGFAFDFANEGPVSTPLTEQQGQPYDLAQHDDVDQYVFVLVRRRNPQLQRRDLALGKPVFNGGSYFVYRRQVIANDSSVAGEGAAIGADERTVAQGYLYRGAEAFVPDFWFQFLYKKFRLELEACLIWGTIDNTERDAGELNYDNPHDSSDPGWNIRSFGMAAEAEFRAIEDRLRLQFKFGYATGDDDIESLAPLGSQGLQPQLVGTERTYSTFRFHPNYRVDLILFRHILSRIQGAYYFRPSVSYDFMRDPDGQRLGGSAALIWSRASQFVQTPGHMRDLGVELNFKLYFQAKDGVLNDDPDQMGGFYASFEYGVLFPLGGLGYMDGEVADYTAYQNPDDEPLDTEIAQTLRLYLGVFF